MPGASEVPLEETKELPPVNEKLNGKAPDFDIMGIFRDTFKFCKLIVST
jgi:hypothetical protein